MRFYACALKHGFLVSYTYMYKAFIGTVLVLILIVLSLLTGTIVYVGMKIDSESKTVTSKVDTFNQSVNTINTNLQNINERLQTDSQAVNLK